MCWARNHVSRSYEKLQLEGDKYNNLRGFFYNEETDHELTTAVMIMATVLVVILNTSSQFVQQTRTFSFSGVQVKGTVGTKMMGNTENTNPRTVSTSQERRQPGSHISKKKKKHCNISVLFKCPQPNFESFYFFWRAFVYSSTMLN